MKTKTIINLYLYVVIFTLIYLEWGYACVVASKISGMVKTGLMILSVLPLFFFKSFKMRTNIVGLFIYLFIVIIISSIRDVNFGNTVLLLVPIFCAFIFTSAIEIEKAVKAFCDVMTFLSLISIFVYLLALFIPSFIQRFPVFQNNWGTSIHDLFLVISPSNVFFIRNYGLTWEPGAFALLLCLCIFCLIVFYDKINYKFFIINVLALITTFSTMGYVVILAIILVTIFNSNQSKHVKYLIFSLFAILILATFFLSGNSLEIQEIVFGKITGLSMGDDNPETTQARVNAVVYPWKAFASSPLFGIGYDSFKTLNETLCNDVATNTIMNWFALGGLLLGLPCTYFYFRAIIKHSGFKKSNFTQLIILIASFILLISTESLLRISLIYIIVFYGCSNLKHRKIV